MSTRLFFVISLTILLLGCSKDQVKEDEPVEVTDLTADPASSSEDGAQTYGAEDDSGPAFSQLDDPQSPLSVRTIYFEYDSSVLTDEGRFIVEAHAAYLANNPGMAVVLEGHADERGTREYNLARGERRATVIAELFQGLGIDPSAIRVVSYGEERAVALGHDDNAWAMNRRVEILY